MDSINFDALSEMRQQNLRSKRYYLRRLGNNKFTLSEDGKIAIGGYNDSHGINVKHGNGVIVWGIVPKDDPRVKMLNGFKGTTFTSNEFENIIKANKLESDYYRFEPAGEFQGVFYHTLVKSGLGISEEDEAKDASDNKAEAPAELNETPEPEKVEASTETEKVTQEEF